MTKGDVCVYACVCVCVCVCVRVYVCVCVCKCIFLVITSIYVNVCEQLEEHSSLKKYSLANFTENVIIVHTRK